MWSLCARHCFRLWCHCRTLISLLHFVLIWIFHATAVAGREGRSGCGQLVIKRAAVTTVATLGDRCARGFVDRPGSTHGSPIDDGVPPVRFHLFNPWEQLGINDQNSAPAGLFLRRCTIGRSDHEVNIPEGVFCLVFVALMAPQQDTLLIQHTQQINRELVSTVTQQRGAADAKS